MIPINRPLIGKDEIKLVTKVLRSGQLTEKSGSGYYVTRFEQAFSKWIGAKYAVAVSSGTAALHAALMTVGLSAGDEVVVPSFSFVATVEAVTLAGGNPVFVDVNPETYCMDPESLERQISGKTKAVIPVHLYGLTCDMTPILKLARKHDLMVIEDSAQAIGAGYKDKKAGNLGDMACFSFYATKNLTTGEGGMVTTNSEEYAEAVRMIRNHGEQAAYRTTMLGHNYRMPEVAAAIGFTQLSKLSQFLKRRRENAEALEDGLGDIGKLKLPIEPEGHKHGWNVYTVRLRGADAGKRDSLVEKLCEQLIGATVYYPTPIHLMPYYQKRYGYDRGMLPETEAAARQVFSLPVHPSVTGSDIQHMIAVLKKTVK